MTPDPGKSRYTIQREIKQKEAAIEYLARRYRSAALPEEELKQCLYSIADNNAYLYQVGLQRPRLLSASEDTSERLQRAS